MAHPPVLAGGEAHGDMVTYHRDIRRGERDAMEAELAVWASRYFSRGRTAELMAGARGSLISVLQYISHAPATLQVASDGVQRFRVYLHLTFGRTSQAQWWVRSISFGMNESASNIQTAAKRATRARLEQAAEDRQAKAPTPRWKIYFNPPGNRVATFDDDLKKGQAIVQSAIERAHAKAKELQPTMKNPIGWDGESMDSLAEETAKAIAGPVAKGIGKVADEAFQAGDAANKVKENAEAGSAFKAAGDIYDLAESLIAKHPVTGLGSIILGSFLSIAIAGDTARVARARAVLFSFYIGGFLHKLVDEPFDKPKEATRKTMHALGAADAAKLTEVHSYQLQLALLHYVSTRNTTNDWSLQDVDQHWKFPDDYRTNWSPGAMGRAFVYQINRMKYLTR